MSENVYFITFTTTTALPLQALLYVGVTGPGDSGTDVEPVIIAIMLFIIIMVTVIIIAVVVAVTMIKRLVNLHTDCIIKQFNFCETLKCDMHACKCTYLVCIMVVNFIILVCILKTGIKKQST